MAETNMIELTQGVCLRRYLREVTPGVMGAQIGNTDGPQKDRLIAARASLPMVIQAMGEEGPCKNCDGRAPRCGVAAAVGDTIYAAARPEEQPDRWMHLVHVRTF